MKEITIDSWSNFKNIVISKELLPQWFTRTEDYQLYAQDGFLLYCLVLKKEDFLDFETNYKDIWNAKQDFRDGNGRTLVHTSPRPDGTVTYFAGAGDNGGIGSGVPLVFNLSDTNTNKSKTIIFSEGVYMKDGVIKTIDAPIGSKISIEILAPNDVVVASFAKSYNLLGDGLVPLNSEDSQLIPGGFKMRVTVYNSDPAKEDNEAKKAFKVVGNMEMYRLNTI